MSRPTNAEPQWMGRNFWISVFCTQALSTASTSRTASPARTASWTRESVRTRRQFCNCTYNVLRVCRRKSIKSYFSESATVFRIANQNSSITCQIGKHKVKYFRTREVYFYSTVNRREQTRPSIHPSKRSSIWIFCRSWLVQARVPNTSLLCP